jgi:hypothetical protein
MVGKFKLPLGKPTLLILGNFKIYFATFLGNLSEVAGMFRLRLGDITKVVMYVHGRRLILEANPALATMDAMLVGSAFGHCSSIHMAVFSTHNTTPGLVYIREP